MRALLSLPLAADLAYAREVDWGANVTQAGDGDDE
jgi:hypothetical protein